MFRPFADPLLVAAECRPPSRLPFHAFRLRVLGLHHLGLHRLRLHRLRLHHFRLHYASPYPTLTPRPITAFLVRSGAQSTCGKAPPSSMSCREAAAPWLFRYGVAHLLSCAA